jgi:hypothetical protein
MNDRNASNGGAPDSPALIAAELRKAEEAARRAKQKLTEREEWQKRMASENEQEFFPLLDVIASDIPFANPFVFETIVQTNLKKLVAIEWLVMENCTETPEEANASLKEYSPSTRFVKTWSRARKYAGNNAKLPRQVLVRDRSGIQRMARLEDLSVPKSQLGDFEIVASDIPGQIIKRTCEVQGCEWMKHRGMCRRPEHLGRASATDIEAIGISFVKIPANPEYSFNCEENGIVDIEALFVVDQEDLLQLNTATVNPNPGLRAHLVEAWWNSRTTLKEMAMMIRARRGFPVHTTPWSSLPLS